MVTDILKWFKNENNILSRNSTCSSEKFKYSMKGDLKWKIKKKFPKSNQHFVK